MRTSPGWDGFFTNNGMSEEPLNSGCKTKILLVSGFVADTYSEIERSYVDLCASSNSSIEYIWLVPEISYRHNRFARRESQESLAEPIWVSHLRESGIQFVVGNISKYNIIGNYLLFREIFKKYPINSVYTHFGYERYWAAFFAKMMGKKVIWNEHWHSLGRRHRTFKKLFYRIFVDEFISVSKFITDTLRNMRTVHTVPNTIMPIEKKILDEVEIKERRESYSKDRNARIVLMVAAFREEKRHDLALKISKKVISACENVIFIFLGRGKGYQKFVDSVRDLELEKNIIAPGHVDNVEEYYETVDVCMLTSYQEPFGYVVLEAMRHGIPVIAFENGGPAEVIRNEETGILVAEGNIDFFAQKLVELLGDDALRTKMGRDARISVERDFNRKLWISRINSILISEVAREGVEHTK
jgi:glycosyltransferase involved in cell wall biosynthesis